jgi:hypothetical protein
MKKIILILFLLCLNLANASLVNFEFYPNQDSTQEKPTIIYESSIVFQVSTPLDHVLCRYSKTKGMPFESMNGFSENFETTHKETLTQLNDGTHRYYVKCRPINDLTNTSTGTKELEAIFKTSIPITAQITLPSSTLKSGKHEVILTTTKLPSSTPSLKYSYDGISYTPIILHGSGTSWKGFLVIPSSTGEKIGSFKFEASDLEGRTGTNIIGESVVIIDTLPPPTLSSIGASGNYAEIKLEWFFDNGVEDPEKIIIYRSESQGVDQTDLYDTIEGDETKYFDNDVEGGKTYYYKISSEDLAGNRAELSREIQATSLLSKTTSSTGLSPSLIGSVDSLLSEIEVLQSDIKNTELNINTLSEEEKSYLKVFKTIENFESAKSELTLLKRNVEDFKLTDVTKETLDGRLSSSRVKLTIIKKKIPDTINKIDSSEITFNPTEEKIRKTILEYIPELSPNEIDKAVEKSLKAIQENSIEIKSSINIFEIMYLDGTKTTQSLIEHSIKGTLEKIENSKIILQFPSGSLDLNSLSIKNFEYTPEKEGLTSFQPNTEKITYTLEGRLDTNILKEISISPIFPKEEETQITGYFLSEVPSGGSTIAAFLIILSSGLIGYLFYIKQQQRREISMDFLKKAHEVKNLQNSGKLEEATKLYNELKIEYISLSKDQKHKVFEEIKQLTKK